MARTDQLKEKLALWRLYLGVLLVTVLSLLAWLFQEPFASSPAPSALRWGGLVLVIYLIGLVITLVREMYKAIEELGGTE